MPHAPSPHVHDRIRFSPHGADHRVLPIDLQGLFDRLGIHVDLDQIPRGTSPARRRRPCAASWLLTGGELQLIGLRGRPARFDFPPFDPDEFGLVTPADIGPTPLWQAVFPGRSWTTPVPATWVDEEVVVLEGDPIDERHLPFWSNYERNRLITFRSGVVTRSWIRHNAAIDRHDPPENPNWHTTWPGARTVDVSSEVQKKPAAGRRPRKTDPETDAGTDPETDAGTDAGTNHPEEDR